MALMRVHFATNRNPLGGGEPPTDFGSKLGPVEGRNLRYGIADVDIDAGKITSLKVAPEKLIVDDEDRELKLGSSAVLDAVRADMRENCRDTFVYIHGFDYTFVEAVIRAAELNFFLGRDTNMFLYTWPSDGERSRYFDDRKDAEASGDAAARAILTATKFLAGLRRRDACTYALHLIAHSMGNYALRHAVQGLRRRIGHDNLPRLFDKIALFGADEDADAFEHESKMKLLPRLGRSVTIYHTTRDAALDVARNTKGQPIRLGSEGPENMTLVGDRVAAVDVSDVMKVSQDRTNHQYYRLNERVRLDFWRVLDDIPPTEVAGRKFFPDTGRFKLLP
jgi:esterase/lipase superfamily enzyme